MYKGHTGEYNVILEAVTDYDLSTWRIFFGVAGSHNDINMSQRLLDLLMAMLPEVT
jgi:hypothetical protein